MKFVVKLLVLALFSIGFGQVEAQETQSVTLAEASSDVAHPSDVKWEKKPVAQVEQEFFVGASEDDKKFVAACRKAIKQSDMGPFAKWRANQRLKRGNFVRKIKSEYMEGLLYWDDPTQFEFQNGKLVFKGIIDWENLDIDKLKALVEIIQGLIEFISNLFAVDYDTATRIAWAAILTPHRSSSRHRWLKTCELFEGRANA